MERKYPNLRRPKRKLCYITEKERPPNDWSELLTMEDVDRMFDDIDVCPLDPYPISVLLSPGSEASVSSATQRKRPANNPPGLQVTLCSPSRPDPVGDVLQPATRSPNPKLYIDLNVPFKAHSPVKTSSPIEQNMSKKGKEKPADEKCSAVSPILFTCDNGAAAEPDKNLSPIQKPPCNGQVTENSDDGEMASPPNKINLIKKSVHKEVLKSPRRQKHAKPCVPVARREPEGSAPESVHKQPPAETSSRVGKDMSAFLQKVQQTILSKPAKKLTVKAPPLPPPPPEPEDDFLILEDDAPLWVSIPSKSATKRRQKPSKTSSSDKESVTERKSKDSPIDAPQEQQELETANNKPDIQAVNQKTNNNKKKSDEKNNESENYKGSLPGPADFPAGDPKEQQKPKKKKEMKTVSSNESDEAEGPEGRAGVEAENPSQKTQPRKHKSTGRKNLKDGKEITSTRRTGTIKESGKRTRGSAAAMVAADDVCGERNPEQSDEEPAETEHLGSFSDKEIIKSEADGETKQNKLSAESADSSSADVLRNRRRKPTGQRWLSSQSAGEAENPLPPKKPKQNDNKEPSTTPSTVQDKKDKANKGRSQKQPAPSSSKHTNETKDSKNKQTKRSKTKGKKAKETDEIINSAEEEQKIPDEDPDQEESSPLVFTHRDLSLNSGGQIFQRVYHNSSSEHISFTSSAPEDQPWEAEPSKRRRKPPCNWWEVNTAADVSGSISSQAQQLHCEGSKPQKELKKQSKLRKPGLGTAKNGNIAAGSKPPGGAPAMPLRPLSTPKSAKRSEATFRDIFTSAVETPAVLTNRDAHQSKRRTVPPRPADQDAGSTASSRADEDLLCGDVGECSGTQHKHESPRGRMCLSEDTLKVLRSGPSSMIEMEKYEGDDADLRPPRVQIVLSASDLCSAPLKPLTLHSKDKSALTEWFQSLWSSTADDDAVVTPDHFQWYFYQDRALGIQADLNSTAICSGKILMGSYMKKPLWVDHSATTVFNLLTSSVSVTVDGSVSRYSPGQAFMVECGRAYSIHNTNAQPAVLYFTRVSAESSD